MLLILLLIGGLRLVKVTMDVDIYVIEGILVLMNNIVSIFSFMVTIHIVIFQAGMTKDIGQGGPWCPHFVSK